MVMRRPRAHALEFLGADDDFLDPAIVTEVRDMQIGHVLYLEEIHQPLTEKDLNIRKVYTILQLNISPTKAPKKYTKMPKNKTKSQL